VNPFRERAVAGVEVPNDLPGNDNCNCPSNSFTSRNSAFGVEQPRSILRLKDEIAAQAAGDAGLVPRKVQEAAPPAAYWASPPLPQAARHHDRIGEVHFVGDE